MPGKISVIIPVYNHAKALATSLISLFNQTYKNLEIIVVDDGSDEEIESVIFLLNSVLLDGGSSKPVINFIKQPHSGASAARNRGLKEASGEYVLFWDADTIAMPEMLERLEKQLREHIEADYCYCKFKFGWKTMKSQPFNLNDLKKSNYIDTTSLIRRNALPPRPFDESLKRFQDWDLWLTLMEQNKIGVFLPEVLYKKITRRRKGYSYWLPGFVYKYFNFFKKVKIYNELKSIVVSKHNLT